MTDLVISYHSSDTGWAKNIAQWLESANYTILLRAWDAESLSGLTKELTIASKAATGTIILLSPEYMNIKCSCEEWKEIFYSKNKSKCGLLLPVEIRESRLDNILHPDLYISLVGFTKDKSKNLLQRAVRFHMAKLITKYISDSSFKKPPFIKAVPHIWNIPFHRNPNFTGRESLLANMRELLSSGAETNIIALHGLGGIGKTRLAVEYSHRFSDFYSVVWWIRGEEITTIDNDLTNLARKIGIEGSKSSDQIYILKSLSGWLEESSGWLLIFDNVENPFNIPDFIMKLDKGHIVITTRNPNWEENVITLPVTPMKTLEACNLLERMTEQHEKKDFEWIAEHLGHLPLALEQVGAYIKENNISTSKYIELLKTSDSDFSTKLLPCDEYPVPVTAAFELTLKKVEKTSKEARELLNICSFLAPDDIPLYIFDNWVKKSNLSLSDIVNILEQFSLIESGDNSFSIHRIVQRILRNNLDEYSKKQLIHITLKAVNDAFLFNHEETKSWGKCSSLISHLVNLSEFCSTSNIQDPILGELLKKAGKYLDFICLHSSAKDMLEKALSIKKLILGQNHPEIAEILVILGGVTGQLSDWKEAKKIYELALDIDITNFGPVHLNVSRDMTCLGAVLFTLDNLSESQDLLKKALTINQTLFSPEHIMVGRGLLNYGESLNLIGHHDEALRYYKSALKIFKKEFGSNHYKVATVMQHIGVLYLNTGKIKDAMRFFKRAMEIDKATFSEDHRRIADNYLNYGRVHLMNKEPEQALYFFNRALVIHRKYLEDDHMHVAQIINLIGQAARDMGDLLSARIYFENSIDVLQKTFPANHRKIKFINEDLLKVRNKLDTVNNKHCKFGNEFY